MLNDGDRFGFQRHSHHYYHNLSMALGFPSFPSTNLSHIPGHQAMLRNLFFWFIPRTMQGMFSMSLTRSLQKGCTCGGCGCVLCGHLV